MQKGRAAAVPPRRPGRPTLRSNRRGRIALGAVALTALATLGLIFGLNAGEDERRSRGRAPVQPRPTVEASSAALELSYRYPRDWRRDTKRDVVRLISPGRSVAVTIGSPTSGNAVDQVFADLRRQIEDSYSKVDIVKTSSRANFAGRPARQLDAFATNEKGERISILGVVGTGRSRTYLIQVFSSTRPELVRLQEARRILDSFRFTSRKRS